MTKPVRAFRLTMVLEADTREDLASLLIRMADGVQRNEITVGVSGSPSDGAIYELLHDTGMTHERYFSDLRKYLDDKGAAP